jgi:hypothetical protein
MKIKKTKPEYIPIRAVTGDDRNFDMLVEEIFHLQARCNDIFREHNINTKQLLLHALSDSEENGIAITEEQRGNISNRKFSDEQEIFFEYFKNRTSLLDAIKQDRKALQFMGNTISKGNQKKASNSRPLKNHDDLDDGDSLDDVIARLSRSHPNEKPGKIWPHLKTAIFEWAGTEVSETGDRGKDSRKYQFKVNGKVDTISFGVLRKKLRQ